MCFVSFHGSKNIKNSCTKFQNSLFIDFISFKEQYKLYKVAIELLNFSFVFAKKERFKKVELKILYQ